MRSVITSGLLFALTVSLSSWFSSDSLRWTSLTADLEHTPLQWTGGKADIQERLLQADRWQHFHQLCTLRLVWSTIFCLCLSTQRRLTS